MFLYVTEIVSYIKKTYVYHWGVYESHVFGFQFLCIF